MIAGGSTLAVAVGVARATASRVDWEGMSAFASSLGGLALAFGGTATALAGIYFKVRDNREEIEKIKKNADEAEAKAEAKIVAAKAEADAKVAAVKAEADKAVAAILAQNSHQQAEINRLRERSHDTVNQINRVNLEMAARLPTPDPDRPLNVTVVNDPAHPVPVVPPAPDAPPGGGAVCP